MSQDVTAPTDTTEITDPSAPAPDPGTPPTKPFASFDTQEQYTESIGQHVNSALAPKLRKIEELEAQLAEQAPPTPPAPAPEKKPDPTDKQLTAAFETQRSEWAQQRAALEQQQTTEKEAHAATVAKYEESALLGDLQSMLSGRVTPTALGHAATLLRLEGPFQRREGKTVAINPTTKLDINPQEAIAAWLAANPHFATAPPSGGGTPGGTPPGPAPADNGQNIQNIRDPYSRFRAAQQADVAAGKVPYPGWKP